MKRKKREKKKLYQMLVEKQLYDIEQELLFIHLSAVFFELRVSA